MYGATILEYCLNQSYASTTKRIENQIVRLCEILNVLLKNLKRLLRKITVYTEVNFRRLLLNSFNLG